MQVKTKNKLFIFGFVCLVVFWGGDLCGSLSLRVNCALLFVCSGFQLVWE